MLINEKKLNMMNVEHRKLLEQEMINFLFEGKDVHIEGYTPEEKISIACWQSRRPDRVLALPSGKTIQQQTQHALPE